MNAIGNRYDFVYLFDVSDGNPNGDPDAANQPRVDPETGHGLVSDVCIKRKIRNFVALAREDEPGYDIYVKQRSVLSNQQKRAYQALSLEPGDRPNDNARAWMCQNFYDVRAFGAVMTMGRADPDGSRRRKTSKQEDEGADAAAESPAKKKTKQWNCGQVRGPVQITFARSVVPIVCLEHTIVRCALTNADDTGHEPSEDDSKAATVQLGRKTTIPYALYRLHGFVSPSQAADTGFSEADLRLLWQALCQMFDHDHSAARGQMAARGLYVFKHGSKLGNAPAHILQARVIVKPKEGVKTFRAFADFTVRIESEDLPAGVELIEYNWSQFAEPARLQCLAKSAHRA
jgi:CRISPR-associated protein Csd2